VYIGVNVKCAYVLHVHYNLIYRTTYLEKKRKHSDFL